MKKLFIILFLLIFVISNLIWIDYSVEERMDWINVASFSIDIKKNEVIVASMFTQKRIPSSLFDERYISEVEEYIGLKIKHDVVSGQIVYQHMFYEEDKRLIEELKLNEYLYLAPFQTSELNVNETIDILMKHQTSSNVFVDCLVSHARVVSNEEKLYLAVSKKDYYYLKRAELISELEGVVNFESVLNDKTQCSTIDSRVRIDKLSR